MTLELMRDQWATKSMKDLIGKFFLNSNKSIFKRTTFDFFLNDKSLEF